MWGKFVRKIKYMCEKGEQLKMLENFKKYMKNCKYMLKMCGKMWGKIGSGKKWNVPKYQEKWGRKMWKSVENFKKMCGMYTCSVQVFANLWKC